MLYPPELRGHVKIVLTERVIYNRFSAVFFYHGTGDAVKSFRFAAGPHRHGLAAKRDYV